MTDTHPGVEDLRCEIASASARTAPSVRHFEATVAVPPRGIKTSSVVSQMFAPSKAWDPSGRSTAAVCHAPTVSSAVEPLASAGETLAKEANLRSNAP